MDPLRILVVDDHPIVLQSIVRLLESYSEFRIVGAARSVEEAMKLIDSQFPEVVLMDFSLPGVSGVEAIRRVKAARPSALVLAATFHNHGAYREAASHAGADHFLLKDELSARLPRLLGELWVGLREGGP
jgi:DNA-binding NarL/FixJ family response regulator